MSARSLILLVVALMVAGGTAYMVRGKLKPEDAMSSLTGKVKVLVASKQILAGTFVRADKDLTIQEISTDNMKPDYVKASEYKQTEYNGAVARRTINKDDPVSRGDMVKSNEGGFMSAVLHPGMRAVSIPVTATSGNAGLVFPGDRVDLIVTHEIVSVKTDGSKQKTLASETFVDDIRVVATDQMLNNPENKAVIAKTVTLEVSPKQAEMINVATRLGEISISLRSFEDADSMGRGPGHVTRDSDVSRLLNTGGGIQTKVNITRGNQTEQIEFQGQGANN